LIKQILDDLVEAVNGAQAALFLDGEGEAISQSGVQDIDVRLIGAWKEIQLDRIKDISKSLMHGDVRAVMYSLDQRNELVIPVGDEYCVLLILSVYATIQESLHGAKSGLERLNREIG
jgi:predicted regulator of Ras-like GTPase activity (Roadblock/LC7/MglB family)